MTSPQQTVTMDTTTSCYCSTPVYNNIKYCSGRNTPAYVVREMDTNGSTVRPPPRRRGPDARERVHYCRDITALDVCRKWRSIARCKKVDRNVLTLLCCLKHEGIAYDNSLRELAFLPAKDE